MQPGSKKEFSEDRAPALASNSTLVDHHHRGFSTTTWNLFGTCLELNLFWLAETCFATGGWNLFGVSMWEVLALKHDRQFVVRVDEFGH